MYAQVVLTLFLIFVFIISFYEWLKISYDAFLVVYVSCYVILVILEWIPCIMIRKAINDYISLVNSGNVTKSDRNLIKKLKRFKFGMTILMLLLVLACVMTIVLCFIFPHTDFMIFGIWFITLSTVSECIYLTTISVAKIAAMLQFRNKNVNLGHLQLHVILMGLILMNLEKIESKY